MSLTASGVTLTLQGGTINDYISDTATLSLVSGSTATLDYLTTDIVQGLVLDGISQPPGIYNSNNEPAFFNGTGSITVVPQPVPEPATWAMVGAGGLLLAALQRFHRKR